ncbi:MAG: LCP family protein [Eubacterium sp.]|nr:LCP family protein [Eubacterium sp.]
MGKLMDRKLSFVFIFLQALFSVLLCLVILYVGFIPDKYAIIAVIVCIVLLVYQVLAQLTDSSYIIGRVLSVIFCIVFAVGGYYLHDTYDAMAQVSGSNTKIDVISYYVLASDPAQSLQDAKDYTYGILSVIDRENTDKALAEAKTEVGQDLHIVEYQDSSSMVDALYAKEIQVAVFNQGFVNTVTEQFKTFSKDTRQLVQHEIETQIEEEPEAEEEEDDYATSVTEKPFIVYMSGIDVYGDLTTNSRSDVNVLMVVNPLTHKLLLVSTPRDYYVPLYDHKGNSRSGGMPDKLTHAGIYGVEVSMGTLEHLYGVDVKYYIRVNFSSVKQIINLLGGVRVYSDFDFISDWGPYGAGSHYTFKKGYNKVNGKKGLAFCRERHHFENGDYQRGRDHQHMIEAILNKVMSPTVLGDYPALLKASKNMFQTNMSTKKIVSLCKMQLDEMSRWKISYANAAGTGTMAYTYSMPSTRLYVCQVDPNSVAKISTKIKKFMDERPGDETTTEETDNSTQPLNDQGTTD